MQLQARNTYVNFFCIFWYAYLCFYASIHVYTWVYRYVLACIWSHPTSIVGHNSPLHGSLCYKGTSRYLQWHQYIHTIEDGDKEALNQYLDRVIIPYTPNPDEQEGKTSHCPKHVIRWILN